MNERERLILTAIIKHYLEFGESVGSRTLEKKYDIGVSSATIRNTMADLEDKGYIKKTHTSSGRTPTSKGYKIYVEELIKIRQITIEEKRKISALYKQKIRNMDNVYKETSRLLANFSDYAGIVLEPSALKENIKKVELVHINDYTVMLVIVKENSMVKTSMMHLKNKISEKRVKESSYEINEIIKRDKNFTVESLEQMIMDSDMKAETPLELGMSAIDEPELFLDGTEKLIDMELNDVKKMMSNLRLFNNEEDSRELFTRVLNVEEYKENEVNIVFGEDLGAPELENLSFVFSIYRSGNSKGVVGIIGPKRMQYSKTVGLVENISKELNKLLE